MSSTRVQNRSAAQLRASNASSSRVVSRASYSSNDIQGVATIQKPNSQHTRSKSHSVAAVPDHWTGWGIDKRRPSTTTTSNNNQTKNRTTASSSIHPNGNGKEDDEPDFMQNHYINYDTENENEDSGSDSDVESPPKSISESSRKSLILQKPQNKHLANARMQEIRSPVDSEDETENEADEPDSMTPSNCRLLLSLSFAGMDVGRGTMVVLAVSNKQEDGPSFPWTEIGRTETQRCIEGEAVFTRRLELLFSFCKAQPLKFSVYCTASTAGTVNGGMGGGGGDFMSSGQELLANAYMYMADIVTAPEMNTSVELINEERISKGTLEISAVEMDPQRDFLQLYFRGSKLYKAGDVCLSVTTRKEEQKRSLSSNRGAGQGRNSRCASFGWAKEGADGSAEAMKGAAEGGGAGERADGRVSEVVARTEFAVGTTEPIWRPVRLPVAKLCGGGGSGGGGAGADYQNPLYMECLYRTSISGLTSLGQCKLTGQHLLSATKETKFPLIREGQERGVLHLVHYDLLKEYTFLDHLSGGLEISLVVAIDFTSSNQPPENRNSLHFLGGEKPNEYEQIIRAITNVIIRYDRSNKISAFGYGAETPMQREVSHCFPLNFDESNPEVEGVEGVIEAYKQVLRRAKLSGPTIFSQVIRKAADYAARSLKDNKHKYTLLLIITDGSVDDLKETREALRLAATLPLGVVIVGVGDADFTNVKQLAASCNTSPIVNMPNSNHCSNIVNNNSTTSESKQFVKFVAYREFKGRSRQQFTTEALRHLPEQIMSYLQTRQALPRALPKDMFQFPFKPPVVNLKVRTTAPTWVPDREASACSRCRCDFHLLWRRHHCRYCGGIFCEVCSQYRAKLPFDKSQQPQRVCDECYATILLLENHVQGRASES